MLWLRVFFSEKYQYLTTLEDLEDNKSGDIKSFSIHQINAKPLPSSVLEKHEKE
jgi:hypothetical protein